MDVTIENNISTSDFTKHYLRRLIVFCTLMFLGVFFRDVYGLPINKFFFLFITLLAYFYLNESFMVAFIAFLIPFLSGLPANFIIGAAIPVILFKQKDIKVSIFALAAYVFLILESLHLFDPLSSIGEYFKFSVYIILITIILLRKGIEYNYTAILLSYGIGVIASFTSIFIDTLRYTPLSSILEGGIRIGNIAWVDESFDPNSITLTIDQNTLGYFCVIAIAVFLLLLYSKKINPIITTILIIITFIYGSLTLSRTFILISVGAFLYYFIVNLRISKDSFKTIISLLIALIIIISVINHYFPSTIEVLTQRFQEKDITNGRALLFEQYNQFMFSSTKNFLFGVGLENMYIKADIINVPHNGFQQIFVADGILGLVLLLVWLIGMYLNNRPKNTKKSAVYLLPLITLLLYIQGLQFLTPYIIMLPLIVVICALRLSKD